MRALTLSLSFTALLSLVTTVHTAALLPRSLVCADDSTTRAGDLFTRAHYPIPCTICVPNTRIFVIIRTFEALTGTMTSLIHSTLTYTLEAVNNQLRTLGDVAVPAGCLNYVRNGVRWISINANNHQQTLGVVQAAVKAVMTFMNAGQVGWVTFDIWDGQNQVGGGQVYREWHGPDTLVCGAGALGGGAV